MAAAEREVRLLEPRARRAAPAEQPVRASDRWNRHRLTIIALNGYLPLPERTRTRT